MKRLVIITFLIIHTSFIHAQAIRISVNEKVNDVLLPLANTEFEITLNDTLKLELNSGSNGQLGKIQLEKGVYKIVLSNPEFNSVTENNVVLDGTKTIAINVTCTRKKSLKNKPENTVK